MRAVRTEGKDWNGIVPLNRFYGILEQWVDITKTSVRLVRSSLRTDAIQLLHNQVALLFRPIVNWWSTANFFVLFRHLWSTSSSNPGTKEAVYCQRRKRRSISLVKIGKKYFKCNVWEIDIQAERDKNNWEVEHSDHLLLHRKLDDVSVEKEAPKEGLYFGQIFWATHVEHKNGSFGLASIRWHTNCCQEKINGQWKGVYVLSTVYMSQIAVESQVDLTLLLWSICPKRRD